MKHICLALSIATTLGIQGTAFAESSTEDRLLQLERRLQQLEQHIQAQDAALQKKDAQIAELQHNQETMNSNKGERIAMPGIEFGGVVEVEASRQDPYTGNNTSDITIATVALGVAAQINDMTDAEIALLYEEDNTPLEVDVARIGIAPSENWRIDLGQIYVPFGSFESFMVSDPLTLEIGETRETVAMGSFANGPFSAAVYAFNGNNDVNDNTVNQWGATAGYASERLSASVGYLNDLSDSDTIQATTGFTASDDNVGAWTAAAVFNTGNFTFIGEYLAANDSFSTGSGILFKGAGAKPSAWNLEAGYGFRLGSYDSVIALGYQGTEEAYVLGQPERRLLSTLSIGLLDNTSLSFEVARDDDYSVADGGTGNKATTVTGQLAVEF